MTENWKVIEEYPDYSVSDKGRVKGFYGKIMKPQRNNFTGYRQVILRKDKNPITKSIHRLVAETFIPTMDETLHVNHKDGNKHNNRLENLEWISRSENAKHAYATGLFDEEKVKERAKKGGEGAIEKLGKRVVLIDKEGKEFFFDSGRQACRALNLDSKSLGCVLKKRKSYNTIKGFKAYYQNEYEKGVF